jgi:hypothetical protein
VEGYKIAYLQVTTTWQNYITELCVRANRPEYLEVEPEEKVHTDGNDSYILHSEVENTVKEIWGKRAVGDDDVPGDFLKMLGEVGLRIKTQRIINIYEHGV